MKAVSGSTGMRRAFGAARMAAAAAIVAVGTLGFAEAAGGPFDGLDGLWSGTGTISLKNGTKERMRCRGQYLVQNDGNNLQQSLQCTSDSYKFHVTAFVNNAGGKLSGNWSETTRNVRGGINGRASKGNIQVSVNGGAFTAKMSLTSSATRQSVTIRPGGGTDVTEVAVGMSKVR